MKAKSVEVSLLGQKITLKSSGDPELIREVLELVSEKIQKIEGRGQAHVPHLVALLALLDLGEDYVQAKRRFVAHQEKMAITSHALFQVLETEYQ